MLDEWRKQMRAKEGGGTPSAVAGASGGTPARPGSARPPSASFDDGHDKKRARMNDSCASAGPLPLPPQQNLPPVAPPVPAAAPVAPLPPAVPPAQPPMAASSPSTAMGEGSGGTALERFKARQALRQQREQQQQQMAMGYDDSSSQQHAMPPLPPAAAPSAGPMRSGICYDDDEDDHADQDYYHQDADYDNRSIASGRSHHSAGSRRGGSRSATPSRAAGTPLRSRAGRMSLIGVGAARKPSKAAGSGAGGGGGSRRKTMSASGSNRVASSSTPTMANNNVSAAVPAAVPAPPVPGEYEY